MSSAAVYKKSIKTCVMIIMSLVWSTCAVSEELQVDYKTFYSHVRKLDSEDTNALQFAFGFVNIHTKALCEISSARISTQKQQIPIHVTAENRFTLPSEKALRLADALVILELTQAANICDISVQLETKPEYLKRSYDAQELKLLLSQYQTFFDDIGGFMSFLMPKVNGITIQFSADDLSGTTDTGLDIKNGRLFLSASDVADINTLVLPQMPLRITASTTK